ncbi:stabilizer of axonemal microtubules 1 [Leptodactylus fuscus]|uniref:stabilizer of axonemal microtubules 1 n=1 Tax=Leptodactylus fuscus TaxID=238119 RepID=UPI003F4E72F6
MQCICQICVCGRHHCPQRASGIYDKLENPSLISEYTDKYLAHQYKPVGSYKPRDIYQKSSADMESMSTFRADYVPHVVFPRKPRVWSKDEQTKKLNDMDTIYKQDYCLHSVRPSVVHRPLQNRQACKDKMDIVSSYQGDYQIWNFSKREPIRPANTYHPPKERFDMKSTFQEHFQFWPITPAQSCKPVHLYTGSLAPFDYITNYRIEYVPYQTERIRINKKETYKPNKEPFDFLTINKQDYKGLPGKAAKPLKPKYCLSSIDIPFSGLTEFQDKYQVWPLLPSLKKKSVTYKKPADKMDIISTIQHNYKPHVLQPQISSKPVRQYCKCSTAFEARSTTREDFQPWQCKKLSPIKPQSNLHLPIGSFENMTTARHDYRPHPLTHTVSFKPVTKTLMPLMPIDAQTIYSTSYTLKPVQVCPASHKDIPGYVYLETDCLGHKQYKLQSVGEKKSDPNHAAGAPLSAEISPPENCFISPREMEVMA